MNNKILTVIVTIWAVAVGIGFVWMTDYASRPGKMGVFPEHTNLKQTPNANNLAQLFLFIHPQCPCSKATLKELLLLEANAGEKVNINVYFYQPDEFSPEWTKTDLWFQAKSIKNVTVSNIKDAELKRFGVMTSGQALLYDANGDLVFSGGITINRGDEGFSNGRRIMQNFLLNNEISEFQTPVFGCALNSQD